MPVVYDELTEEPCPDCGAPLRYEEHLEGDGSVSKWMICDECGYAELLEVEEPE